MHARTRAPASGEEVPLEASGDESSARTVITPAVALLVHKLNLWASVQLWIMHALRVATGRPQRAPRQARAQGGGAPQRFELSVQLLHEAAWLGGVGRGERWRGQGAERQRGGVV